jgi:hypothetical protein
MLGKPCRHKQLFYVMRADQALACFPAIIPAFLV